MMRAPMQILYAAHHTWKRSITEDVQAHFGQKGAARLRSVLNNIGSMDISHEFAPLTDETLDWFIPLYQEAIGAKNNPKLFDIRGTTIGKDSKYTYHSLTITEHGKPIGATLFSERNSLLSIAYRIYPNTWNGHDLRCNPSLYAEYLMNEYGLERGFTKLSHGRDRNPYGRNSHIGLAIFKLSVGCSAYLPNPPHDMNMLDLAEVDQDILVFKYPTEGERITEGVLYVAEENLQKYIQVTKYPERLSVETIIRGPK